MVAAAHFAALLPPGVERVTAHLYGSLALTGRGHATDTAVLLGLTGAQPDDLDPDDATAIVAELRARRRLRLPLGGEVPFEPGSDIVFHPRESLPLHTNGLAFSAETHGGQVCRVYYSIGGGFVADEAGHPLGVPDDGALPVPHPFANAAELLRRAGDARLTIAELVRQNESVAHPHRDLRAGLVRVWAAMRACVTRGLAAEGELPGALRVRRRAPALLRRLEARSRANVLDPLAAMDWVNLWALAVNEENAAGGRVVTAPTNGAAGIIPAVLHYYERLVPGASPAGIETFLLAASAIGAIIKRNASISGAEMGCQGEVGSACAMAAAGLAAALGGTNAQVENAAEIGLEHNLGLTCDPVGGLVQVPCIERNAIAAVKAINAARLALHGDGTHRVSLDQAVATMRQTGRDMSHKYKETSLGGLAVNVVEC
jgi:L-serine dehydratase